MNDGGVVSGWRMVAFFLRTQLFPIHLKVGVCPRCLHVFYLNGSWTSRWLSLGLLGFGGGGGHRSLLWMTLGGDRSLCVAYVWLVCPSGLTRR